MPNDLERRERARDAHRQEMQDLLKMKPGHYRTGRLWAWLRGRACLSVVEIPETDGASFIFNSSPDYTHMKVELNGKGTLDGVYCWEESSGTFVRLWSKHVPTGSESYPIAVKALTHLATVARTARFTKPHPPYALS